MFYRTLLAAVAAIAIASPVFADDTAAQSNESNASMQMSENNQNNQAAAQASDQQQSPAEQVKINLNTASAKDLMKIKGLNASKSRAIIAYRKKHGNFKSIDDLSNVKGFKKMDSDALKSIEDQLTIE